MTQPQFMPPAVIATMDYLTNTFPTDAAPSRMVWWYAHAAGVLDIDDPDLMAAVWHRWLPATATEIELDWPTVDELVLSDTPPDLGIKADLAIYRARLAS